MTRLIDGWRSEERRLLMPTKTSSLGREARLPGEKTFNRGLLNDVPMSHGHLVERDIRLFLVMDALFEEESVTRAAERLGVTQSAVSHALRAARIRLGDPLFVKTARGMSATPRSEALRSALRAGFREFERVLTGAAPFDVATAVRRFTTATHEDVLLSIVSDIVPLSTDAPGLTFTFEEIGPRLAERLENGELDVVMARGEDRVRYSLASDLIRKQIVSENLVCLMRKDHPMIGSRLDLDRYLSCSHVAISATGEVDPVDAAFAAHGQRRIAFTVATVPAAAWFVAACNAIATVPEQVARRAAARMNLSVCPLPISIPASSTYLWWHRRFHLDPSHIWWRGYLVDALRSTASA